MFENNYRFKLSVTVTGNGDDGFTMLGLDFLRVLAATGIATVVSTYGVLLIAKMSIHFSLKHLLQYLCMKLFEELAYIGFGLNLAQKFLAQNFIGHCLILYSHFLWHFTKL